MIRALLAHPQEALHKRHLVYCMRVMSVGCYQGSSGTPFKQDICDMKVRNWMILRPGSREMERGR
jgi:hypothetical protein